MHQCIVCGSDLRDTINDFLIEGVSNEALIAWLQETGTINISDCELAHHLTHFNIDERRRLERVKKGQQAKDKNKKITLKYNEVQDPQINVVKDLKSVFEKATVRIDALVDAGELDDHRTEMSIKNYMAEVRQLGKAIDDITTNAIHSKTTQLELLNTETIQLLGLIRKILYEILPSDKIDMFMRRLNEEYSRLNKSSSEQLLVGAENDNSYRG